MAAKKKVDPAKIDDNEREVLWLRQPREKDVWHTDHIIKGQFCAGRIKQLDKNWFCVYHNGKYLGHEKTMDAAQKLFATGKMKPIEEEVRAWEKEHRGELPPFLKLTDGERRAWWHHNPPKPGAAPGVGGKFGRVRPDEDPATRRLREQAAAGSGKGARAARKAAQASLSGVMVRLRDGNPKKPGSAPHGRWSLMFEYADRGSTVEEFTRAGGNPTTLENAIVAGWVKVQGKEA